ncbi:MAG: hypothetical protein NVS1B13_19250 [Flavisolibacter sp.]
MRKITNIRKEAEWICGDISLEYLKYYAEVLEALKKVQSKYETKIYDKGPRRKKEAGVN